MLPAYNREIQAGLRSVLIDENFADQLSHYKRGCSVYSDDLKEKLDDFISAKVQSLHGHPETFMSRSILEVLRADEWAEVRPVIFVDEGHLVMKWGEDFR